MAKGGSSRSDAPETEVKPATRAPWAAAIDIGLSKCAVMIGSLDSEGDLLPRGIGVQSARRGPRGEPCDFDAAARCLRVALDQAERASGLVVETALAAYCGPGIRSTRAHGITKLLRGVVDARDAKAALDAARDAACDPGRAALHVVPLCYRIDDGPPMADPRGKTGQRLAAEVLVVTAPQAAIAGIEDLARDAGLRLTRVIAGPYATGLACTAPAQRQEGALVIDLGASATGIAAYVGAGLVHCETLPVGGARLSEDLAGQFGTSFAAAERAKVAYGGQAGLAARGVRVEIPRLSADGRLEAALVDPAALHSLLNPMLSHVFELVAARIAKAGFVAQDFQSVAVTGGGAMLANACAAAQRCLGIPAEIAIVDGLEAGEHGANAPIFSTCAGLLRWALDRPIEASLGQAHPPKANKKALRPAAPPAPERAVGRAWEWLRENL